MNIKGLAITESLTSKRLRLLEIVRDNFGFKSTSTLDGNIFIYIKNKRYYVNNLSDIPKLKLIQNSDNDNSLAPIYSQSTSHSESSQQSNL